MKSFYNILDYEQYKKIKLNNQFTRANANDDMDISPNSSPLSDTYSNSKSQSPQKHQIPVSHAFQKPQLFGPKSLANSNISNPGKETTKLILFYFSKSTVSTLAYNEVN